MDTNETMVNDNTEIEGVVPEAETAEEQPVEQVIEDEPKGEPAKETSEPGYVKKRIDKAVQRAIAETEARMKADFEKQMAPIRERLLTEEAKELVSQGEFKSLERAKEYLQMKQGVQPRQPNGQFAPKDDPVMQERIKSLARQGDKIKASTGVDVVSMMVNDNELKEQAFKGEIDMYDILEMAKSPKEKPPVPMRSSNGASGYASNVFETMSQEAFERMEKQIDRGVRYTLK